MDEKIEDKSENSKKNHLIYYRSLSKIISRYRNRNESKGRTCNSGALNLQNRGNRER